MLDLKNYRVEINDNLHYGISVVPDFDKKLPQDYIKAIYRTIKEPQNIDFLRIYFPWASLELIEEKALEQAEIQTRDYLDNFLKLQVNDTLIKLCECDRKKDQISLLKGFSTTVFDLFRFFIEANNKYNYLFSFKKGSIIPKDLSNRKLPILIHYKDDNTIISKGETELTEGEEKRLIEQRKIIIAYILENENNWMSFFGTYNSIYGKETYQNNYPHIHFISNLWGITKEDFIQSIKSGNYRETSVHILLE